MDEWMELGNHDGKLFFVSTRKISENISKTLNCYFSNQIYTLAHQSKYLPVGN